MDMVLAYGIPRKKQVCAVQLLQPPECHQAPGAEQANMRGNHQVIGDVFLYCSFVFQLGRLLKVNTSHHGKYLHRLQATRQLSFTMDVA